MKKNFNEEVNLQRIDGRIVLMEALLDRFSLEIKSSKLILIFSKSKWADVHEGSKLFRNYESNKEVLCSGFFRSEV